MRLKQFINVDVAAFRVNDGGLRIASDNVGAHFLGFVGRCEVDLIDHDDIDPRHLLGIEPPKRRDHAPVTRRVDNCDHRRQLDHARQRGIDQRRRQIIRLRDVDNSLNIIANAQLIE